MAFWFRTDRKRWMVQVRLDVPGKGRMRVRRFSPVNTKRGAEAYERQLREKLLKGVDTAPAEESADTEDKRTTLRQFAAEFLRNYCSTYNRASEVAQKKRVLKNHFLPAMGDLRLDEVDARVLAAYSRMKLDQKLHPNTVNHHLACISKMLHQAEEWGYLDKVPRMRKLEVPPPSWDFLLPDESDRLLVGAQASGEDEHALVLTAVRTGLRISELLALRWEDLDLVAGTLRVHRSRPEDDVEVGPKTKKERVVELSPQLRETLQRHRHLRSVHVFCGAKKKPLTRDEANHILWRACRKAKLRRTSWRMLRHTFASQLRMAGRDLQEVKELLGHTDIAMTLRYAHLGPTARRDAVASLDNLGASRGPHAGHQVGPQVAPSIGPGGHADDGHSPKSS
jgi:integrase